MKKKGKELKWMLVTEYTPEDGQKRFLGSRCWTTSEGMEVKRTK